MFWLNDEVCLSPYPQELLYHFLAALNEGKVCLHPSDTLPGLTFHPLLAKGRDNLLYIKQRESQKPFVSLVNSIEKAMIFWQPLPGAWERILSQLWPGPLTVVWKAQTLAPVFLQSKTGSLALRYPKWQVEDEWMKRLMESVDFPLPSTSINIAGDMPCRDWPTALEFLQGHPQQCFIPKLEYVPVFSQPASTIIELHEDGSFTMLREAAMPKEVIMKAVDQQQKPVQATQKKPIQIYLASESPRRKSLLAQAGVDFIVSASSFVEKPKPSEAPEEYVLRNAIGKGQWLWDQQGTQLKSDSLIISADTIVVLDNRILEKPSDAAHAKQMLSELSGRWHRVFTGLCFHMVSDHQLVKSKHAIFETDVLFKELSDKEIQNYIASGDPFDKAGSYGIQGLGSFMIKEIKGSYTNVMGLPLAETIDWLKDVI